MTHPDNNDICLDCVLTSVVMDMLDAGNTIPEVWDSVQFAVGQWMDEKEGLTP